MNGWHEAYNDLPGPDVVCGHLRTIAVPPTQAEPADACLDCLAEGTTWIELRTCLVCGQVRCCESSARQHGLAHFKQTGHALVASVGEAVRWGWCYADGMPLSPDSA
jgi:monovalent cation/hydrogen antiporter